MNSSIIIGYSFLTALALVFYVLTYNNLFSGSPMMMVSIVYWLIYLVYAYFMNFAVNSAIQYSSCSTVDIGQTAINSIWVPIFSVVFLGISSIGFFKNAILNRACKLHSGLMPQSTVATFCC